MVEAGVDEREVKEMLSGDVSILSDRVGSPEDGKRVEIQYLLLDKRGIVSAEKAVDQGIPTKGVDDIF